MQVNSAWRSTGVNTWTNIIQHTHERHIFLLGSDLHNFADDNTVTAVAETNQGLINSLEVTTSNATEWMKNNDMIANPDKFKAIVLTKLIIIQLVLDCNLAGKPFSLAMKLVFQELQRTNTKLIFDSHITKLLMP